MIIDELVKNKNQMIAEHKEKFSKLSREEYLVEFSNEKYKKIEEFEYSQQEYEDVLMLEMFQKKYKEEYYGHLNFFTRQPFINQLCLTQINFWDNQYLDAKTMPRLHNKIYQEIENFPDYDYLNSVAYEMLIRTSEYKSLTDYSDSYNNIERIRRCDQLGIDIHDISNFKNISKYYGQNKIKKDFSHSYFSMTLNELEDGLNRLIRFYVSKKQIYVIDEVKKIVINQEDEKNKKEIILGRTFKVVPYATVEEVKASLSNYFIPTKFNYQTQQQEEKYSFIDNAIPLVALERDFLISIDDLIPNRIKSNIEFNFTRPSIRFKELPIVDVPLNLNLSTRELTELVAKIKSDFEDGLVKNPINILYETKYEFKRLSDITPFKLTKKSMAEAFFVYDLYQYINISITLHKTKLRDFEKLDFKDIENRMLIKLKNKEEENDLFLNQCIKAEKEKKEQKYTKEDLKKPKKKRKIKLDELTSYWKIENKKAKLKLQKEAIDKKKEVAREYKKYLIGYHPMIVLENIVILYGITPYMCKQYLIFMRKYIDNLQYKELIIGAKVVSD